MRVPMSFPVGRVLGIPVRVHLSWFIVLVIATVSFGQQFDASEGVAIGPLGFVAGFVSAMLLFVSVLLHELGHCVFARYFGIHVRQIQLFIFGGVAEILGEPRRVLDEVIIAAAGPAVSFVLTFVCFGFALLLGFNPLTGESGGVLAAIAWLLALMNFLLGFVNLIPAFPTDGGRILRAILWGVLGDYRRATAWAAGLGMAFAATLVFGGILTMAVTTAGPQFAANQFQGLWFVFLGLFLARSASQAKKHASISAALREGTVSAIMTRMRIAAPAERTLLEVFTSANGPSAAELILGFPVLEQGKWAGFVESSRIPPKEEWGKLTAGQLMTPLASMAVVRIEDPLDQLVRVITERNATGALVMHGPDIVGYVDRTDVLRWLIAMQHLPS